MVLGGIPRFYGIIPPHNHLTRFFRLSVTLKFSLLDPSACFAIVESFHFNDKMASQLFLTSLENKIPNKQHMPDDRGECRMWLQDPDFNERQTSGLWRQISMLDIGGSASEVVETNQYELHVSNHTFLASMLTDAILKNKSYCTSFILCCASLFAWYRFLDQKSLLILDRVH